MKIYRPLGKTEKLFYKMRDYGGQNAVGFAHGVSSAPFDQALFKNVLKKLKNQSPLLCSKVVCCAKHLNFVTAENQALPLTILSNASSNDFDKTYQKYTQHDYSQSELLWQMTLIEYKQHKDEMLKFSIVIGLDHLITDGSMMLNFMNLLLTTYDQCTKNLKAEHELKEFSHDLTQALERPIEFYTQYQLGVRDFLNFLPFEMGKILKPPAQPKPQEQVNFSQRSTHIIYHKLSPSKTRQLIEITKQHNTSVHGVLIAASLFAVSKVLFHQNPDLWLSNKNLSVASNVSFRKTYKISGHQTGCYISAVNNQYCMNEALDFWPLAMRAKEDVGIKIRQSCHISSMLIYEWLQRFLPEVFRVKIVNGEQQGRLETLVVSNVGKLNFDGQYPNRQFQLTDLVMSAAQHGMGPSFMLSSLCFQDQLSLTLHYVKPLVNFQTGQTVMHYIQNVFDHLLQFKKLTFGSFLFSDFHSNQLRAS